MGSATRALVYTEDASVGGDRRFLDRLQPDAVTRVAGLHWTTSYPGGDVHFSANLTAPPDLNNAGVQAGRRVYIQSGGAVRWSGFLDNPKRGDPWQISGTGLASMVTDWTAIGTTLDAAIDNAITRGLPYSRNGVSLGSSLQIVSGSMTLDAALAQAGKALGMAWTLDPSGVITMAAPPTTPTYVLNARQALNPTLVGFTQAVGYFQDSSTTTQTITVSSSAAQAKFGKREGRYDMTGLGIIAATGTQSATTYLTNWLNANLANWRYSNTLTVSPGQLRIPGGGPVDLATVRAGCMVLVTDVDPSHETLLTPGQLTMLVGATDYDVDNDVLTLTPVGMRGQNLLSIIYQSLGGAQ